MGKSLTVERCLNAGDGKHLPTEYKASLISDSDRNRSPVTAVGRNLSTRRNAEKALRESEQKYRELANSLPQVVFEIDETGKITFTNQNAFTLFGYTTEDFEKDLNCLDLLIPADRERAKENILIGLKGQPSERNEYTALRKDGSAFPVAIHSSPIFRNGIPVGLRGLLVDMTEKKKAERVLLDSERRYRVLFESAGDGIYVHDFEGNILDVNEMQCRRLGYSREEFLRLNIRDFIPEDVLANFSAGIKRLQRKGNIVIESAHVKKDGTVFPIETNSRVIEYEGKQAVLAIIRNITERKTAEKEKEKLHRQLHHAERMEAIGTLAGGIAHDFNNLLMGIQGRTSMMLLDTDRAHPYYDHLKGIEDYIKSAADLAGQLLGFARGGKYEVEPADLNGLVKKSSEMFGRTKKEVHIHIKYQEDLWAAEVDLRQIEQALLNLYVNAWQAMPGGGDLYLETANVILDSDFVKPYVLKPGRYVKISVADTGVGMDKKTCEKIFEPFFTTKEMGRGTGLGLASAYGIVKNHSGIISVYSEKGEGSQFNIFLPASDGIIFEKTEIPKKILTGSETILLIDDEEMILTVGKEILDRLGYNIFLAENGEDAVDLYEKNSNKIDVVILDMIMPDMGGGEVFERLKEINPAIRVLLSSGYSLNEKAQILLDQGCKGFLQKPFNLEELSRKLREIIEDPAGEQRTPPKGRGYKSEARNPKQYLMTKIPMFKTMSY